MSLHPWSGTVMLHKALLYVVPCACSLRMYNSVVERCFKDCVESFRRKDLEASEEKVCQPWPGFTLTLFLHICSFCSALQGARRSS